MADNPKSLASLADEYRIGDGKIEYYRKEVANCQGGLSCQRWSCIPIAELIGVIDALRAPTIAADERCESCRKVLGRGWKYDSTGDVKLCLACYTALSTPSPTIAVTDDDVKEALDEYDDYAELNTRETNMRAALENFAYRKGCPTIAAPSPSNEPAVEWVMCAVRDAMREHNFVVERGSDLWNRLRRHIEAALDGWHDGAGQ